MLTINIASSQEGSNQLPEDNPLKFKSRLQYEALPFDKIKDESTQKNKLNDIKLLSIISLNLPKLHSNLVMKYICSSLNIQKVLHQFKVCLTFSQFCPKVIK